MPDTLTSYPHAESGQAKARSIKILKRWTIYESFEDLNFPWIMKLSTGQLLMQASRGTHCTREERIFFLISSDEGQTWKPTTLPMRFDSMKFSGLSLFEYGDALFAYESRWNRGGHPTCGYRWSRDASSPLWKSQAEVERDGDSFVLPRPWADEQLVRYDVPDDYEGYGLHMPSITMPDGRLVALVFGNKRGSQPTALQKELSFSNTMAIESTDRGLTWQVCGRVTDLDERPKQSAIGYEGPCEPSAIHLGNGHIAVVMRTGNYNFEKSDKVGLLHWSSSHDAGRTWSPIKPLAAHGVLPQLHQVPDGRVFLTYGRPGNRIAQFDVHTGQLGPYTDIFCGDPALHYESCCNPGCVVLGDNRLLMTYSHGNLCGRGALEGAKNRFVAVLLEV